MWWKYEWFAFSLQFIFLINSLKFLLHFGYLLRSCVSVWFYFSDIQFEYYYYINSLLMISSDQNKLWNKIWNFFTDTSLHWELWIMDSKCSLLILFDPRWYCSSHCKIGVYELLQWKKFKTQNFVYIETFYNKLQLR